MLETKVEIDSNNQAKAAEDKKEIINEKWFDIAETNKSYEVARKMLIDKQDLRLIEQATGLTMSEIKKLAITL